VVVISPIVSCLASTIVLTDIFGLVLSKLGTDEYIYTCICTHIFSFVCIYVYMDIYGRLCKFVLTDVFGLLPSKKDTYECTNVFIYVDVYTYIQMYIDIINRI
jgi:TctA family transporter